MIVARRAAFAQNPLAIHPGHTRPAKKEGMPRRNWPLVLGFSVSVLACGSAAAHPHVWIDYGLTVTFDKGRVVSLKEDWSFDEDFSASVLRDVAGAAKAKTLTAAQVAKIEKNAFSNLKNYDYFTHIFAAGAPVHPREATGFQARLSGPKLEYSFVLPLDRPVDAKPEPAAFGIWDDTYYVDVGPAEGKAPKLEGDGASACQAVIVEDRQHPIYFGSVFPKTVRVTC